MLSGSTTDLGLIFMDFRKVDRNSFSNLLYDDAMARLFIRSTALIRPKRHCCLGSEGFVIQVERTSL